MTIDQLNRLRIERNEARIAYLQADPKIVDRAKKLYKDADFRYLYGCREFAEVIMNSNGMLEKVIF